MTRKSPARRQKDNQKQIVTTSQTVTHYEGIIPHPDILKAFNELVPGTAAELIKLAVDETNHRRNIENVAINANVSLQNKQLDGNARQAEIIYRSDMMGKISGLIVCLLCILASVYIGVNGHDLLAGAIAAIPTGALIKAFLFKK